MSNISGWLNIYKPPNISSAGLVAIVKKIVGKKTKVGHAGTLDLEAEGVLPIAIGEATKLIQFLVAARKAYRFKIQFGACTNTGDKAGKILRTTHNIPTETEATNICSRFIGSITQIPPAFSALKIKGVPAYSLARQGEVVELKPRKIEIFSLNLENYDYQTKTATYYTECSKGTYIRTLAEDISLSLQSLGFVLELCRTKVGLFSKETAVNLSKLSDLSIENILNALQKIEVVLADIPVFDVNVDIALKVRYGQKVTISHPNIERIWLRANNRVLAIGSIVDGYFNSDRVINVE